MSNRDSNRALWLILACVAAFRVVYVLLVPIDLAGDEAYYWDWGRQLDWGYFSKPPGIAWLMALVDFLSNGSALGLRIAPIALGTAGLAILYFLTNAIADSSASVPAVSRWNPGLLAVLLVLATPSNAALNLFLTIDSPLVLCWTAALLLFWNWTEGRRPALTLVALTVVLGLGYLSKQMMMVFPLLGLIYLISTPEKRGLLKRPSLYFAIALSFCFLAPPLIWNANNDWITFQHTSHHFESGGGDAPWWQKVPEQFFTFVGTQMGALLTPVTWLLAMTVAVCGLFGFRKLPRGGRYLVIFCAPALIVMHFMALRQTMQPNWPAVYYVATFSLLACWLSGAVSVPRVPLGWQRWAKPALVVGFSMAALLYLIMPVLQLTGNAGLKWLDPSRRALGHAEVGERAGAFFDQVPRPENTFIVGLGHRYLASHLAFYMPGQPRTYRWERSGEIMSQYELWPNPAEDGRLGQDGIIFLPEKRSLLKTFEKGFESVEKLGEFEVVVSPHLKYAYTVYLGRNLQYWPDAPKK